ncbi:hypothetical protein H9L39_09782 [Fusarium oxysporum f. sp. albedinis]|nr:hypothetical protein H9L39_09782 [Fusarium oxysporum f. sp. albedinis]
MPTLAKPRQQVNSLGRHDITSRQECVGGVLPRGINAEKMRSLDQITRVGPVQDFLLAYAGLLCKLKIISFSTD